MQPQMDLLSIPVPPATILEQAVGYPDDNGARYLALWWACGFSAGPDNLAGDEAMISDGVVTSTGNRLGYLAYIHHQSVYPHLDSYHLGSSDEPARHHLMIDLITREAFIVLCNDSQKIMEENFQFEADQIENMEFSDEQLELFIKAFEEGLQETDLNDEFTMSKEDEGKAVKKLTRWLDHNGKSFPGWWFYKLRWFFKPESN